VQIVRNVDPLTMRWFGMVSAVLEPSGLSLQRQMLCLSNQAKSKPFESL
jgi:hypothetical protein